MPNSSLKSAYPFGSVIPGRTWSEPSHSAAYKFGFNGKEKVDEISGEGNDIDFGSRICDTRVGRWLSVDPLQIKYPDINPYNFCMNNPIVFVDKDGRDIYTSDAFRKSDVYEVFKKIMNSSNPDISYYSNTFKNNVNNNLTLCVGINWDRSTNTISDGSLSTSPSCIDNKTKTTVNIMLNFPTYSQMDQTNVVNSTDAAGNSIRGYMMADYSEIGTACLLFHEMIHANLCGNGGQPGSGDVEHNMMAGADPSLTGKMTGFITAYCKENKIDLTKAALANGVTLTGTDEGVKALCWIGLEGTEAYKKNYGDSKKPSSNTPDQNKARARLEIVQRALLYKKDKKFVSMADIEYFNNQDNINGTQPQQPTKYTSENDNKTVIQE